MHLVVASLSEVDSVIVESRWCIEPVAAAEMNCHCSRDTEGTANKQNEGQCPLLLPFSLPLVTPMTESNLRKLQKASGKCNLQSPSPRIL